MAQGTGRLIALPFLALCLASCSGPEIERPEGWFDPGLAGGPAPTTTQLHLVPGRYTLPERSSPAGHDPARPVVVELSAQGRRQGRIRHTGTLPYELPGPSMAAPEGMTVRLGDQVLPYGEGPSFWRVRQNELVVFSREPVASAEVSWEAAQAQADRFHLDRAGLSEAQFVRYQLTLNDITRDGLLLPAPATAEWELTLPESGGVFETWLAMAPPALQMEKSDGARVHLEIAQGDEVRTVAQQAVPGQTDQFQRWAVDLSRFGGQQVTLRLRTDPGDTPWFDYVFLGSPTLTSAPTQPVRRIVVIGLDTTRPDHFSWAGYPRPTTPELDAIFDQSAVFTQAWCPAPRTRPSFRSATTGRYPLKAVGATNIGEVFRDHGFATAGIVANVHLQPIFDFNQGFDLWQYNSRSTAKEQVDQALAWLRAHRERDSYLFLHIMDPHIFYNAPGSFRNRFVTDPDPDLPDTFNRWQVYQMDRRGELTAQRKEHIKALYDGEMAYMSYHLDRFFKGLDALGGQTLVVLHSDHGEEFWEHGGFEHNHTLYDEVTRAVLAFRPGQGMASPLRIETPATLADIGPTLYDFAGLSDPPPTDGRSLRPLLEGTADPEDYKRPIDLGFLRYGREKWGVVWEGHKLILDTRTGQEELYDLSADPAETRDLSAQVDLAPFRAKLAEAHEMPVGRGWRIFVDLHDDTTTPFTFTFPRTPDHAGILDPERTVEAPANQAWGQPPTRTPDEIGQTTWDASTLTLTPGQNPVDGQIIVLWGEDLPVDSLSIQRGDEALTLVRSVDGSWIWRSGRDTLRVAQSTVVVPLPGEAELLRLLKEGSDNASEEQIAWLEAMGYLGGSDEEEEPEDPSP